MEFLKQIFINVPHTKFHGNPSSGSRTDTCGQTDGQTDMKNEIVAFRHYAKAPKKKFLDQMSKY